jgi:uncharacterized protein
VSFAVRVTPRGGADRIEGVGPAGELLVRVRAAPADGAANAWLIRLIAETLDVAPSLVRLERGATARRKQVSVEGLDAATLMVRWPGLVLTTRS